MTTVVADVHAVLSTTPERWQQLIRTLPPALLSRAPAAGEWSALQCLVHLLDAERVNFPVRVQAVLAGQDLAAFDPNRAPSDRRAQTPDQLATAFARARQDSLVLLEQLREDDLARTAQHPAFGPVTLAQLLATWAAHDLNHTVQAERALMQPFLLSCGAWRSFFEDHAVGGAD